MKYCQICEITDSDDQDIFCQQCGRILTNRPIYEDPAYFKKPKKLRLPSNKILFLITLVITVLIYFSVLIYLNYYALALISFAVPLPFIEIFGTRHLKSNRKKHIREKKDKGLYTKVLMN